MKIDENKEIRHFLDETNLFERAKVGKRTAVDSQKYGAQEELRMGSKTKHKFEKERKHKPNGSTTQPTRRKRK